ERAYDDQAFLLQTLGTEGATNGSGDIKDALYKLLYSLRFVSLLLPKTRTFALGFVVSHDREEVETCCRAALRGLIMRKSASLKDDFIKSAMGAMDRTLSSFNEESSVVFTTVCELLRERLAKSRGGFRRRVTEQTSSATIFAAVLNALEGSALA
ncbi:hypothetical protein Tco_1033734, partial [Tanacetum coccineum]